MKRFLSLDGHRLILPTHGPLLLLLTSESKISLWHFQRKNMPMASAKCCWMPLTSHYRSARLPYKNTLCRRYSSAYRNPVALPTASFLSSTISSVQPPHILLISAATLDAGNGHCAMKSGSSQGRLYPSSWHRSGRRLRYADTATRLIEKGTVSGGLGWTPSVPA